MRLLYLHDETRIQAIADEIDRHLAGDRVTSEDDVT